jgi:hypothetical protein
MVTMRQTNIDDDDDFPGGICRDGGSLHVTTTFIDSRRRFAQLTDEQARRFQPGFRGRDVGSQPDPAAAAYEISKSRLSAAWRGQSGTPYQAAPDLFALAEKLAPLLGLANPIRASSGPLDPAFVARNYGRQSDGTDARRAAYDAMVARGQNAWKTPVGRDGVAIEEPNDLVKAIEEAIAKELEGRDRRPSATDPNAATAIEKRLERWQGNGDLTALAANVEKRRAAEHSARSRDLSNAWRGGR